jgi:hypothetical protein
MTAFLELERVTRESFLFLNAELFTLSRKIFGIFVLQFP